MAKPLVFHFADRDISFQMSKVDRTKLYGFKELEVLDEDGQACELATLAELKTLENLYLGNTPVDDSAVASLKQMEQLQLLFLLDTRITANAVAELQPVFWESCTIIHRSGTYQGTRKSPLAMAHIATEAAVWHPSE